MSRLAAATLAAAVFCAGCGKSEDPQEGADPTANLPAKYKSLDPVPLPDFEEAAKSEAFRKAVDEAAALLGSAPQPLQAHADVGVVKGGVSFEVPQQKLDGLLRKAHSDFLRRGAYLFRHDSNFGIGGNPDRVGLLPTTDKYAVIAAMGTNGANYDIGTAGILAWLKDLEVEQPFVLTGIGFDYLEGHFTTPVKNRKAVARRMYQFCPDIVEQGVGGVAKLEDELRKDTLYLWWD